MSAVETLIAKLAAEISALVAERLLSALHPHQCRPTVASAAPGSQGRPRACSTQRNGMHTFICAGRDRHCSRNVRRSSGHARLGVPLDLRLTADKPHE